MTTAISDYETSINEANVTKGAKVSAREAQDEDISEAMSLLRHLDLVMRNKFAGNRAMLTEWTSASHVERHSTGKQPDNPPTPKPPTSPPSDPSSGSSSES